MRDFFQHQIDNGHIKSLPRSGKCMFCGNLLVPTDIDHSVCNKCWDETFTCTECGEKESHLMGCSNWEPSYTPDWDE